MAGRGGGAAAASVSTSKPLTTFLIASAAPSSASTRAAAAAASPSTAWNRSKPLLSLSASSSSSYPKSSASSSALLFSSSSLGPGRELSPNSNRQRQRRRRRWLAMASSEAGTSIPKIQKSEEEWRTVLSPEQFRILRQKGTEWAGTGKYDKFKEDGLYECAACGTPLYKSTSKFNSGCGWPAFFEGLPGAINETVDADGSRVEITCAACGGHLGHNFKGEGFPTPTDERHCVNSISLKFTPADK